MTKEEREVMQMALEALELSHPRFGVGTAIHIKAVATLRQAIEQAQQAEPVAIAECKVVHGHMCQFLNRTRYGMDTLKDGDKLYTKEQL